jgi:hypothetical protein
MPGAEIAGKSSEKVDRILQVGSCPVGQKEEAANGLKI